MSEKIFAFFKFICFFKYKLKRKVSISTDWKEKKWILKNKKSEHNTQILLISVLKNILVKGQGDGLGGGGLN